MAWLKGWAEWVEGDTACISVPFTWLLPQAWSRCVALRQEGYRVRAGGPAVSLRLDYLAAVAEIGGDVDALARHNPDATFTTRGCTRQCAFCAVPRTEGSFRELIAWEPKPIVCDNNFLASSRRHFDRAIDCLKPMAGVDFNQGLDPRLLTAYHAGRLAELDLPLVRLSWDDVRDEVTIMDAIGILKTAGFGARRLRVYVLIGFEDRPDDALYRLETLKGLGILANVQRFQPLWSLSRNDYIAPTWTDAELKRYCRHWNRQAWLGGIPFADYR